MLVEPSSISSFGGVEGLVHLSSLGFVHVLGCMSHVMVEPSPELGEGDLAILVSVHRVVSSMDLTASSVKISGMMMMELIVVVMKLVMVVMELRSMVMMELGLMVMMELVFMVMMRGNDARKSKECKSHF